MRGLDVGHVRGAAKSLRDGAAGPLAAALQKIHQFPAVMDELETIRQIEAGRSIARYGDGELGIIRGKGIGFHEASPALRERLREVLYRPAGELLVCVPNIMCASGFRVLTAESKRFWRVQMVKNYRVLSKLEASNLYGNASFTRPYIRNLDPSVARGVFERLRSFWSGREITIVEGESTRMGVGNDLFSSVASIERIICPSSDSFRHYSKIYSLCEQVPRDRVLLLALGPTATVLASDLCDSGRFALDIGHLDLEYEWYTTGSRVRRPVRGKQVNELSERGEGIESAPGDYRRQIVARIGPH